MMEIKTVLISVYNKTNLKDFAECLTSFGIEIISSGGTSKFLKENGINVIEIADITKFPEMLDGRVKTLHPMIHGGILAVRSNPSHIEQLKRHNITPIDMVVVNLYPFEAVIAKKDATLEDAVENIDIGGPTLIRSAAKNFESVAVITNPGRYDQIIQELKQNNCKLDISTRKMLAIEAFNHTSRYDTIISSYLGSKFNQLVKYPPLISLGFEKVQDLRYGENPHQNAAFYKELNLNYQSLANAKQLSGKELSFNNLYDMNAALEIVRDFEDQCCVIIKHTNPCGFAIGSDLLDTYIRARDADPSSAFGSIVGFNREVDEKTASEILKTFVEVVIAPGFDNKAIKIFREKANLRIIDIGTIEKVGSKLDWKKIDGGLLIQDKDTRSLSISDFKIVSNKKPDQSQIETLSFAWKLVKHVKSNAIVITNHNTSIGIGAGQMSRVDSVDLAIRKGANKVKGCVLASDAFFPFRDSIDLAAKAGITAIIEPGGSIRDEDVIKAADEHDLVLIFTVFDISNIKLSVRETMDIETEIVGIKIGDQHPVRIIGIINLSLESFYKQSITTKSEDIINKIEQFSNQGVHFIDIGARSTAPGVKQISIQEELERIVPPLKNIMKNFDIPISIDTQYSEVAEKALRLGAHIINDVSGFRTDPKIIKTITNYNASTIIMASKKQPGDCLGIESTLLELRKSITDIENSGLNPKNIIIDPAIGKWVPEKVYWYNLELIERLSDFKTLKKPILVSISRKSFIGDVLNYPDPKDRLIGTLACTALSVYHGAHIIRTHDVKETKETVDMIWNLKNYKKIINRHVN